VVHEPTPRPPSRGAPRIGEALEIRVLDGRGAKGAGLFALQEGARAGGARDVVPAGVEGGLRRRIHAYHAAVIRRGALVVRQAKRLGASTVATHARRGGGAPGGSGRGRGRPAAPRSTAAGGSSTTDTGCGGGGGGRGFAGRLLCRATMDGRAALPAEALLVAELTAAEAEEDTAASLRALIAPRPVDGAALAPPLALGILRWTPAVISGVAAARAAAALASLAALAAASSPAVVGTPGAR
jgi:hypothetical protein